MIKKLSIILSLFVLIVLSGCARKYVYTPQEIEDTLKAELNMNTAEAKEYLPFLPTDKTSQMLKNIPARTFNVQSAGLILIRKITGEEGFNVTTQMIENTPATVASLPKTSDPIEHINTFIALAREAGFEAVYVKVSQNEGYNSDEFFNYVENHICAGIKAGDKVYLFDFINNPRSYKSFKLLSDPEAIVNIMNLRGVNWDKQYRSSGDEAYKQKAIKAYKSAFRLVPDFAHAMNNLAVVYIRDGKLDEAEELLHKSLDTDKSMNVSRYNLAEIYLRKGNSEQAMELLRDSLDKSPKDPYTNYRLGMIYFIHQKTKEAEERFLKAISLKKDFLEPRLSLLSLLIANNRLKDAETLLKDSQSIFPDNQKLKGFESTFTNRDEEVPE